MELSPSSRFELLKKAADIAIQAASGTQNKELLAEIIETTFNKMVTLAGKS